MKKQKYHHIKKAERLEIAILLNKSYFCRDIAKILKRSSNNISREIKENSVNGKYNLHKANHKAYAKGKYSKYQGMKIVANDKL
jgi:IS30 family transposase